MCTYRIKSRKLWGWIVSSWSEKNGSSIIEVHWNQRKKEGRKVAGNSWSKCQELQRPGQPCVCLKEGNTGSRGSASWLAVSDQLVRSKGHKPSYNVAFVVAYVPQKHLLWQNWQNLLMTHFFNASCTTHTMLYTTCCLHGANFHIILDKDITTGN